MTVHEVPREQWAPFLESFSAEHYGWLASLGVRGGEGSGTPSGGRDRHLLWDVRFHGASLDRDRILLMLGDNGHAEDHRVNEPEKVLLETAEGGVHRGLSVVARDGATSILRFRAAPPPEAVDGLAGAGPVPSP